MARRLPAGWATAKRLSLGTDGRRRPGTADEMADVAELLMSDRGAFITGADFLIDGGDTAAYFYGPLRPEA